MTDLEMTKLCAEAMGIPLCPATTHTQDGKWYDPLHDDAQTMALVKRFRMTIWYIGVGPVWRVCGVTRPLEDIRVEHADLNRAIVECVANMQKARSTEAASSGKVTDAR